jgi:hypothetical protein
MGKGYKRVFTVMLMVCILSVLFTGCNDTKDTATKDGKMQVSIPSDWKETSILENPDIKLSVSSADGGVYFVVVPQEKPKDIKNFKLVDYYKAEGNRMVKDFDKPRILSPEDKKINGYEVIQFEFTCEIQKIPMSYLITLINTPDKYYKLMGWTESSLFGAAVSELDKITNSFKLVGK